MKIFIDLAEESIYFSQSENAFNFNTEVLMAIVFIIIICAGVWTIKKIIR